MRAESCSGEKGSWEVERKQGSPEKWMISVKKLSFKLNFSNIYYKLKFLRTFPSLSPLIWGPWIFIIDWRYNPNSTCLSILHLFPSQLLAELKNIDMTRKQLQKSNPSKMSKKMNYHVGWTIKRSLQLTFSCYISSGCGSFIS